MEQSHLEELAEFLEHAGSFLRGPPSAPNQPRITFQSLDRTEVERVAELLGVKYVRTVRIAPKRGKKEYFSFNTQLKAHRAVRLMQQVRPLLSELRQEAIDFALTGVIPITRHTAALHQSLVRLGMEPEVGGRAYRNMSG